MRKMKKRAIAAALAVCMLPFGSGSYRTVYAADTTGTVIDMEDVSDSTADTIWSVPSLKTGANKIQQDNKKIAYTDSNGENAYWDGQVFQFATPQNGKCAVSLLYEGEENKDYTMELYTLEADGTMAHVQTQGSVGVFKDGSRVYRFTSVGLENGKTYYFVITESGNLTLASDMQDLTITMETDVPYVEACIAEATNVVAGKTYEVSPSDMKTVVWKDSLDPFAEKIAIYKIVLPAQSRMAIAMKQPQEGSGYAYKMQDGQLVRTDDFVADDRSGLKSGVLYNNTENQQTYYFVTANTITSFGEIKDQEDAVLLETADIATLTLSSTIDVETLGEKRLAYYQKVDGTKEKVNAEGFWIKYTVPKDQCYTVSAVCENGSEVYDRDLKYDITVLKYDEKTGVCADVWYAGLNQDDNFTGTVALSGEGQYFLYINCAVDYSAPITFRMTQTKKITEVKSDAKAITDADVKKGTMTVEGMNQPYAYPEKNGSALIWEASNGRLLKLHVPAGTNYILTSDLCFFRVYESDCKTFGSTYDSGNIKNTSSVDKDVYVWVGFGISDATEGSIQIRKEQIVLPPQAVTNLSAAAAGKGKVRLTWTKSNKADGYLIYAKKNGTYGYCGVANAGTQTSYTDTKAIDTDYNFYWVYPFKYDANGKRVIGKCTKYVYAKGICTATENVKASSVKGGVKLTWSKKAGASGYLIYGKKTGGKYGYIGMTKGYGATSYTDKGALKGVYNFYWVIPYHYSKSGKLVAGQTGKYVFGRAK